MGSFSPSPSPPPLAARAASQHAMDQQIPTPYMSPLFTKMFSFSPPSPPPLPLAPPPRAAASQQATDQQIPTPYMSPLLTKMFSFSPPPSPPLPLAPQPRAAASQQATDQQIPTPYMSPLLTPPPPRKTRLSPLHNFFISKHNTPNQQVLMTPDIFPRSERKGDLTILNKPRRTNPMVWLSAILCLIFSLLLIFFGIATLIIFLVVKPRNPLFDTNNARLNVIYFDSAQHFNSDFTILANFSNPNRKLHIRFEYVAIDLYFDNNLIATQSLRPFTQKPRETGLATIHMISSLVYLPQNHALELQKQVISNKVIYSIRGTFRVRVSTGLIHFSYWLYGRCQLEMTSPPTGVLMARSCKTKR